MKSVFTFKGYLREIQQKDNHKVAIIQDLNRHTIPFTISKKYEDRILSNLNKATDITIYNFDFYRRYFDKIGTIYYLVNAEKEAE